MNSPKQSYSPSYKNLRNKQKQSPIVMKEKMRKDYKDRVQNCRNLLLNKFRGSVVETELRNTLATIYKDMFDVSDFNEMDEEEGKILDEIKRELIEEEIQRLMEEYEKSQLDDVDWSFMQQENVICPVCQKDNFKCDNKIVSCENCSINIKSENSLAHIKKSIIESIEKHSISCKKMAQFTSVGMELNETHIYLICHACMDMQLVL